MLIVFTLIALLAGVAAFSIRGLMTKQEAMKEFDKLAGQLRMAQELMLLMDVDSDVRFEKLSEGFKVTWEPKGPVPEGAPQIPGLKEETYKHIERVFFEDVRSGKQLNDNFFLSFYSKGLLIVKGLLVVKARGIERAAAFPGYPWPIQFSSNLSFPQEDPEIEAMVQSITDATAQETIHAAN